MNPDSLKALLIDQQLGELSPETSELLDAYLAGSPEMESEIEKMRAALGITERTVNLRPDLFRAEREKPRAFAFSFSPVTFRAAALAVMMVIAALGGFFFGQNRSIEPNRPSSLLAMTDKAPWAKYRLSEDSSITLISNLSEQEFTGKE